VAGVKTCVGLGHDSLLRLESKSTLKTHQFDVCFGFCVIVAMFGSLLFSAAYVVCDKICCCEVSSWKVKAVQLVRNLS